MSNLREKDNADDVDADAAAVADDDDGGDDVCFSRA